MLEKIQRWRCETTQELYFQALKDALLYASNLK